MLVEAASHVPTPLVLEQIYRHARSDYPSECCGFVLRSGLVHRAVNAQDSLHAQDSARYPRNSTLAYAFALDDLRRLDESFYTDDPATIIYHSHPNVGAYFSEKDAEDALYEGGLKCPVDFLVVDVRDDGVRGSKLFRFTGSEFVCAWSDIT